MKAADEGEGGWRGEESSPLEAAFVSVVDVSPSWLSRGEMRGGGEDEDAEVGMGFTISKEVDDEVAGEFSTEADCLPADVGKMGN